MVCEAHRGRRGRRDRQAFSSLFIGMVCEARVPEGAGVVRTALSVPSSSGWCVKRGLIALDRARAAFFQFPLHRDGV